MPIVYHPFVHHTPMTLNRAQVRRVVHEDMNGCHCRVVAFQLFLHLFCRLSVDLLTRDKGELEGLKVECSLYVEPLAP